MASARRTGTNENVSTYGAAGQGRDYTSLATWEADTDDAQSYTRVLECYDDAVSFDDYVWMSGATITGGGTIPRIIRPADGEGHDGTPNNGVHFDSTTAAGLITIDEPSHIQDLIFTLTINSASTYRTLDVTGYDSMIVGCFVVDGHNSGSGLVYGIQLYDGGGSASPGAVNCLVHNVDYIGYQVAPAGFVYNCVAANCAKGFIQWWTGTATAKNCIAYENSTSQWQGNWAKTTCFDEASPTDIFVDAANDNFHIDQDTKEAVIGAGTDLSADGTFAFDDDIDGEECGQEWNIGFDGIPENYTIYEIAEATLNFESSVRLSTGRIIALETGNDDVYYNDNDGEGSWTYLSTLPTVSTPDGGKLFLTSSGTLLLGAEGHILRSTDNGANWTDIHTMGWAGLVPHADTTKDRIWNFLEDSSGNIYGSRYPGTSGTRTENTPAEVIKSTDDGANWSTVWGGAHLGDQFDESGSTASLDNHDPDVGDASSWGGDASGMTVGNGTSTVTKDAAGLGIAINSTSPNATPSADDQVVKARVKTGGTSSADRAGVVARATDKNNCYIAWVEGDGYLRLYKMVSGSPTQLGFSAAIASFSEATEYDVVLAVHGTTVEAEATGANRISVTDSAHSSGDTGIALEDTNAEINAFSGGAWPGGDMYHIHGCGYNSYNGYAYFCLEGGTPITTSGMLRFDGTDWTKITEGYQYTAVVSKDEDDKIYLGADTGEDSKIYYVDDDGSTVENSQAEVLHADFQEKGYIPDMVMLSDGNLLVATFSNSPSGDYASIFCTTSADWSTFEERAIQRGLSTQKGYTSWTVGDLTNFALVANTVSGEPSYKVTSLSVSPFTLTGSRIADASRAWQAAEDADVTGWDKSNAFIVAAMLEGAGSGTVQLRWREDGGAWNLLSGSGELTWGEQEEVFGYDSVGGGSGSLSAETIAASALDTPSGAGVVTSIEIYCANSNSGNDFKVGLYEDDGGSPGALVGVQEFTDVGAWSAEWHEFSGLSFSVSGGTSYWIVVQASASCNIYYDSLGGTNRHWNTSTSYGSAWPDPFSSDSSSSAKYSMRATIRGTTDLVNDAAVASGEKGCTPIGGTTYVNGTEREGANGVSTTLASGEYTEHHWAVDCSGASDGSVYEFQLYDASTLDAIATLEALVAIGQPVKTISDTGSGADAIGGINVGLSLSDSGAGADIIPGPSAAVPVGESGAGSDAVSQILASLSVQDSGQGAETVAVLVYLSVADTGSGLDEIAQVLRNILVADSGSGSDAVQPVSASLSIQDSGAGSDAMKTILVSLQVADTGQGVDSLLTAVLTQVMDAASGTDAISPISVSLGVQDAASGAEGLDIGVSLSIADTGAGSDAVSVLTAVLKTVSDIAQGTDGVNVTASLNVSDAGSGAEGLAVGATLTIQDAGAGTDSLAVIQAVFKTVSDIATGADSVGPVTVRVPVSDTGQGLDELAAISAALAIAETAQGVDVIVKYEQGAVKYMTVTFAARGPKVMFTGRGPTATFTGGPR